MADQFGNLGTLSPEDYQQQQQITRQQRMAEMLMSQNQQPQGQMVSGRFVPSSFFQNILPLVNTYVGKGLLEEGDTKAAALAQKLRTDENTGLQNLLNISKGTPAVMPEIKRDDMGNVMPPVQQARPASQEDLIMAASKLRDPSIRNMLVSERFKPKAPLTVASGASVLQQNADNSFTPVFTNPKPLELSTEIKTALALNPSLPRNPDNWTAKDAQVAAQTIAQHKKLSAPVSTTYVDARVANSLAGPIGTMLEKSKDATVGAYNNLTSANAILANVDKAITGPAANQRVGIAQLASTLGLGNPNNPDSLAATRTLIQNMAKLQIGTHVKGEGAVSDFERRLKAAAEGGDIKFTPVEIKQMANTTKSSANYQIQQHNDAIKSAQGLGADSAAIANMYKINPPSQSGVRYVGEVQK